MGFYPITEKSPFFDIASEYIMFNINIYILHKKYTKTDRMIKIDKGELNKNAPVQQPYDLTRPYNFSEVSYIQLNINSRIISEVGYIHLNLKLGICDLSNIRCDYFKSE